ncbi:MAG: hypothetical protein LKG27_05645 [Clostridiaceae bacterium]|jgi:hypothetical protein|nr:hypothetical protein [Clostridiaceae bacterium]
MSVNSITSAAASSYSAGTVSQLSEETKQKLIALGLDPTQFTSETQAQQKIAEIQAIKQQNNTQSSTQQQGNSTQAALMSEAKTLAAQANVSVADTDKLDDILENISDAVSKMDAQNPNTKYFQERLAALENENIQAQQSISSLDSMMAMAATNNKIALGLS